MKIPTLTLATLILITAGACNRVPPPTEGRLDPYLPPQVALQSTKLRRATAFEPPRIARDGLNDALRVTVPVRNTTGRYLTVDYWVTWLDESGRPTNAGRVGPFTRGLPPGAPTFLTADAPTPRAADFVMDIRYAE